MEIWPHTLGKPPWDRKRISDEKLGKEEGTWMSYTHPERQLTRERENTPCELNLSDIWYAEFRNCAIDIDD